MNDKKRKMNDHKLKISEEKFRHLFRSTPFTIILADSKGTITDANFEIDPITNYRRDEILHKNLLKIPIFPPEFIKKATKDFKKLMSGEIPEPQEIQIYKKDGTPVWVQPRASFFKIREELYIQIIMQDITFNKKAELKLKESEAKFRTLAEQSILAIIILQDNRIKYANKAASEMLGYTIKELKNTPQGEFIKYYHPDDKKIAMEQAKKRQAGLESDLQGYDARLFKKNGNMIWVQIFSKTIVFKGNHADIAIAIDITDKKIAEKKLRESEKKYRNIIENTKDAIVIVDFEGKLLYVSPQLTKMLKGREISKDSKFFQYIHKDDVKKLISFYKTAIKEKNFSQIPVEFRLLPKQGDYIWFSSSSKNYYDDEGKFIGFISTLSNITDKRIAEFKLKESEQKYRHLFESSPFYIILLDEDWIIYDCNPSTEKILGFTKNEMIGKNAREIPLYDLTKEEILRERTENLLDGKILNPIEMRIHRKDGKVIWIKSIASLVEIDEKKFIEIIGQDVTERKKAELEKKGSREYLDKIINSVISPIFVKDRNHRWVLLNDAYCDFIGHPREQIIGKSDYDFFPKSEADIFWEKDEKVFTTRNPDINEELITIAENEIYTIITKKTLYVDNNGNEFIVGVINDITERKIQEDIIKESEEKYRTLFETSPNGVLLVDLNGYILECNSTVKTITGYGEKDLIGKNFRELEFLQNDGLELLINGFEDTIRGTDLDPVEFAIENHDGEIKWLQLRGNIINRKNESMVFTVLSDITSQKLAEKALKKSEERYRNLVETSSLGLIEIEMLSKRASYINPKFTEFTGYDREELITQQDFHKIVNKEDLHSIGRMGTEKNIEFRIRTKDGDEKWLFGTRLLGIDDNGDITNFRLWLSDVTEIRKLEDIKKNLLTRFSHEFKTPLISIKGFADLLLTTYKDILNKRALSFLQNIKMGSDRLEVLTNSFIESSRLGKDYGNLELRKENLSELLKTGVEEMKGLMKIRNHTIDANIQDGINVMLDKEKIYTVITNLLMNATKYTPKGGIIKVASVIKEDSVLVSVKDNGIGLTNQEKSQIFKAFGKIERFGNGWDIITDGIGMGLYICKGVVDSHGGKIWVESEGRDKGSCFKFTIPVL